MKQLYGPIYNFTPLTFILPNEYRQVIDYHNRDGNENTMWICKPTDLSRGRGISVINNIDDLKYEQQSVLQVYIKNPLLIRGIKWDMRLYVNITQMRPMKLYLYREGLVRFSTERYDTKHLTNVFSHLTNASINKYAHGAG
jgi:tubulin polyglutamylase TTLL2